MANRKPTREDLFSPEGAICVNPGEMSHLAAAVAAQLTPPAVLSLEGPLGAGKTQFSKGLVSALGSPDEVSSPSFAIIHEYTGAPVPIFHFDFYRLSSPGELLATGYDDCLAEGITIAEWGDKFPEMLPAGSLRLQFEILPDNHRRVRALPAS